MGIDGLTPQTPEEWAAEVSARMERKGNQVLAKPPGKPLGPYMPGVSGEPRLSKVHAAPRPAPAPTVRRKSIAGWKIALGVVGALVLLAAGAWPLAVTVLFFWAIWRGWHAARNVQRDPNGGSFWFFFWSGGE